MQPREPQQPGATTPPGPALAQLAALHHALTRAHDERELLAAIVDHLAPAAAPTTILEHDPRAALSGRWPAAADDPRLLWLTRTLDLTLRRIRDQRARDHAEALARSFHAALAELHTTADLDALLAVLATHAAGHGATAAWLLDVHDPAAPIVLARHGAASEPPTLPILTTAAQFFPTLALTPSLRAAVLLPLRHRDHTHAHLLLAWPAPHDFSPDERDHYPALARQAALVVANHRLLAAARDALREQQHQRATLAAILEHLPVSVVVQSAQDGEAMLMNRSAEQLTRDLHQSPLLYPGSDTPMPPAQWPSARALHDDQIVVGEAEMRAADGTRRTLEAVAAPVHDERGLLTHVISVTTEVTAWRAAEAERLAMHDALIDAQNAALAERSTPLLPIADGILVLPIVGAVDEDRGQQITETLVHLGGSQRVRVAILDVTGAGALDERGAHLLIGAARALRLRGVRPILTGLGTDAAATLAAAGIDLAGIIVLGSLQAGIARARRLVRR